MSRHQVRKWRPRSPLAPAAARVPAVHDTASGADRHRCQRCHGRAHAVTLVDERNLPYAWVCVECVLPAEWASGAARMRRQR
jgi:hypothetical protein